jgi:hypothetical protein
MSRETNPQILSYLFASPNLANTVAEVGKKYFSRGGLLKMKYKGD